MNENGSQAQASAFWLPSGSTGKKKFGDTLHVVETEERVRLGTPHLRFPTLLFCGTICLLQCVTTVARVYISPRGHSLHQAVIECAVLLALYLLCVPIIYAINRRSAMNSIWIEREGQRVTINGNNAEPCQASRLILTRLSIDGPYSLRLLTLSEKTDKHGHQKSKEISLLTLQDSNKVIAAGEMLADATGILLVQETKYAWSRSN